MNEGAAGAGGFSEEVWEEGVVLAVCLEEVEAWVEASLGMGFSVGGAMHGVVGCDSGFISHLDRFIAGLAVSVSPLFLFMPVAPSSLLPSCSLSPDAPSSAPSPGSASHSIPWVVTLAGRSCTSSSTAFVVLVSFSVVVPFLAVVFRPCPPLVDFLIYAISAPKTTFVMVGTGCV